MGGKHITLDNMFKSAKIVSWNAATVEREKDRKRSLEYHACVIVRSPSLIV